MRNLPCFAMCLLTGLVGACSDDDEIDSDEAARRAYLGLDASVAKSINLGFAGFNAATNANIPAQMTTGMAAGTLTISGQVDAGASANKTMRLYVGMVGYSDGPFVVDQDGTEISITYDTSTEQLMQPYLEMKMQNIPTGTLSGSLTGDYTLSGEDLAGTVTLMLTFNGMLMAGPQAGDVLRVPGSTTVTGTATSGDGVYEVNLTL